MPEPITYKSPKLTRCGDHLIDPCTGCRFVCIDHLTKLLGLNDFPEAKKYRIEVSTEQWDDRGGCELWVCERSESWFWGPTKEYQERAFCAQVLDALDDSDLPTDEPVRIYFRLTYHD